MNSGIKQHSQILAYYQDQINAGASNTEALENTAARYGLSRRRIYDIVREIHWPEDIPSDLPQRANVILALQLRADGFTYNEIAERVGMSVSTIRRWTIRYKMPVT